MKVTAVALSSNTARAQSNILTDSNRAFENAFVRIIAVLLAAGADNTYALKCMNVVARTLQTFMYVRLKGKNGLQIVFDLV